MRKFLFGLRFQNFKPDIAHFQNVLSHFISQGMHITPEAIKTLAVEPVRGRWLASVLRVKTGDARIMLEVKNGAKLVSLVDSLIKYLSANPTVVSSCIAVVGSILGAMAGSALTLIFTGYNQREHLEREDALKKEREQEEQKKLIINELVENWSNAFIQNGII
jgi:hypothetical protein